MIEKGYLLVQDPPVNHISRVCSLRNQIICWVLVKCRMQVQGTDWVKYKDYGAEILVQRRGINYRKNREGWFYQCHSDKQTVGDLSLDHTVICSWLFLIVALWLPLRGLRYQSQSRPASLSPISRSVHLRSIILSDDCIMWHACGTAKIKKIRFMELRN